MPFLDLAAVGHDRAAPPQPFLRQRVVHRGDREKHGNRDPLAVRNHRTERSHEVAHHGTVGQHDHGDRAGANGLHCHAAQLGQRRGQRPRVGRGLDGRVEHQSGGRSGPHDVLELPVSQDRRGEPEIVVLNTRGVRAK